MALRGLETADLGLERCDFRSRLSRVLQVGVDGPDADDAQNDCGEEEDRRRDVRRTGVDERPAREIRSDGGHGVALLQKADADERGRVLTPPREPQGPGRGREPTAPCPRSPAGNPGTGSKPGRLRDDDDLAGQVEAGAVRRRPPDEGGCEPDLLQRLLGVRGRLPGPEESNGPFLEEDGRHVRTVREDDEARPGQRQGGDRRQGEDGRLEGADPDPESEKCRLERGDRLLRRGEDQETGSAVGGSCRFAPGDPELGGRLRVKAAHLPAEHLGELLGSASAPLGSRSTVAAFTNPSGTWPEAAGQPALSPGEEKRGPGRGRVRRRDDPSDSRGTYPAEGPGKRRSPHRPGALPGPRGEGRRGRGGSP